MASHDQLSIPVRNEVSGLGEFDLQALAAATFHLGAAVAELVPKAIWETRLPATFGPDVHHVMPAPAQPRRRSQDGS